MGRRGWGLSGPLLHVRDLRTGPHATSSALLRFRRECLLERGKKKPCMAMQGGISINLRILSRAIRRLGFTCGAPAKQQSHRTQS